METQALERGIARLFEEQLHPFQFFCLSIFLSEIFAKAGASYPSPTGQPPDDSFSFIGNVVNGERQGMSALVGVRPAKISVSGNTFALADPLNVYNDHPAGGDYVQNCQRALISGNTLTSGGWGFASLGSTTNVVILKNDYSGAHFQGVADYNGLDLAGPDQSLESVAVIKNIIGSGAGSHLRAIYPVGARLVIIGNQYRRRPHS